MKSISDVIEDIHTYNIDTQDVTIGDIQKYFPQANGCGAKNGIKVPKTIYLANIETACILHDIRWHLATDYDDLITANERFDDDLKRICDAESCCGFMKFIRRKRISTYVDAVELIGTYDYAKEQGFEIPYYASTTGSI